MPDPGKVSQGLWLHGYVESVEERSGRSAGDEPQVWFVVVWLGGRLQVRGLRRREPGERVEVPVDVMASQKGGLWAREKPAI